MALELKSITSQKLRSLPPDTTVFLFPVGSLEDHGPHLPLGLGILEGEALTKLFANKIEKEMKGWSAVIMPTLSAAAQVTTTKFSFPIRAYVLRDWLVDSCRHLKRLGFRNFVCISGNSSPRQLTAIEEAGKIVCGPILFFKGKRKPKLLSATSALTTWAEVKKAPLWPDPDEHGGKTDTSIALALSNTVDPSYKSLPARDKDLLSSTRLLKRLSNQSGGYWGNPAHASAELGDQELTKKIECIFPKLRNALEGASPRSDFRSWYSILPPNRSFYKSWMLFSAIVLLVGAYIYLFQKMI